MYTSTVRINVLRYLLLSMSLLIGGSLQAQNARVLTGKVIDQEGMVLASAQIVLLSDEGIKAYTLADYDGNLELEIPEGNQEGLKVEVRMFGYSTYSALLSELVSPVTFRLAAAAIELEAIEVTADALPIAQREDTLMFNTDSYTDGTEEKVEDMLRKIPGIQVEEDGAISVQGRTIDRVLIDGDDAFGRNYRLATQNINAGFINRVDVINNYTEDLLTGDLDQNKELVLNLKLEDSRKKILFGEIELATGLPGGMDNDANLFLLSGKVKAIMFAQNNTLGQDPSSGINMSYQMNGNSGVMASHRPDLLSTPTGYRPKSINPREYLRNEVYATAGSILISPTKNIRSRTIYSLDNNLFRMNNQERLNFFGQDLPVTVDHYKFYRESERKAWIDSENSFTFARKNRLDVNLKATVSQQDMSADLTSTTGDQSSNLLTNLSGSPQNYNGRIRMTRRLNDMLAVRLILEASYESNDQQANHLSDRYSVLLQQPLDGIRQDAFEKTWRLNPYFNVLYNSGKWFFDTKTGYRNTSGEVNAQTFALTSGTTDPIADRLTNFNYNFKELYLNQDITRTFGKLIFRGAVNLSSIKLSYDNLAVSTDEKFGDFIVQPQLSLDYRISSRGNLNFNAGHRQELPAPNQLVSVPYLSDYQTLVTGLDTLYLQRSNNLGIRYRYANSFRQLIYFLSVQRTSIPNGLQRSLGVSSLFTEQRLTAGFPSNSVQLHGGISKFVRLLSGTLDLDTRLMQFNNQLEVNEQLEVNRYQIVSTKLNFLSSIKEWLKMSLSMGYQQSENISQGNIERPDNTEYTYNYGGGFTATIKPKTMISLKGDGYTWEQNNQQTHTFLATFEMSHTFPSGLKIRLLGTNLFNQGTFYQNYVNSYQISQRSFLLRPRTLIFGINWSF